MIQFTDEQLYAVKRIALSRGDETILRHAAEEFAEASAALNQFARARYYHDGDLAKRKEQLVEELADAYIMLGHILSLNPDLPLRIETKVGEVLLRTIDRYCAGGK